MTKQIRPFIINKLLDDTSLETEGKLIADEISLTAMRKASNKVM